MKHYPYIIIGQGLAGSILSLYLVKKKVKHLVLSEPDLSRSSLVAAGLANPIVLKRLKLVHEADAFFSKAPAFYQWAEKMLNASFYYPIPVWHLIRSQEEQNHWLEKSEHPAYGPYLHDVIHTRHFKGINSSYGFGEVQHTFWVHTQNFIQAVRRTLGKHYVRHQLSPNELDLKQKTLSLPQGKISFEHLVDCSGHLSRQLFPYLQYAFNPTRGEVLVIKSTGLPEDIILHAGVFVLPLGNNYFKVGASYHWDELKDKTTAEGRAWLIKELQKIYSGPFDIVDHLGGVRPNVKDRKPLIGPVDEALYAFNGMGSRAVLMAPFLAEVLLSHIENNQAIPEVFQASRFT